MIPVSGSAYTYAYATMGEVGILQICSRLRSRVLIIILNGHYIVCRMDNRLGLSS